MHYQIACFLKNVLRGTLAGAALVYVCSASLAQGVGDLLIAPTRVVFDGQRRTAEINLINIGEKPATYRISLIHQRMNDDGKLEEIQTPGDGEQFADELIRFTPRQVELMPHVAEMVRIQLRLPAELASDEFRSHLLFRAVPTGAPLEDKAGAANSQQGLSIKLTPIYGVSIPVIVRHSKMASVSTFTDLKLKASPDGTPVLTGRIARTGNGSVYGDIVVTFGRAGGKFVQVGKVAGIAVYTPNAGRTFAIKLTPKSASELADGTLRVAYRQASADGNGNLAEASIAMP